MARRVFITLAILLGGLFGVMRAVAIPVISQISINDVTVTEGNSGNVNAVFTVTLSQADPVQEITVDFSTSDDSAKAPADYTSLSGRVTFPPGSTTQTISVTVIGDTFGEPNEAFFVNLSNAQNGTINDGQGRAAITNNDGPAPALSVPDVAVDESAETLTFTISLSPTSGQTVTVDYETSDDTATEPSDYAAQSGTLTFPPGNAEQLVTVTVNEDAFDESDESLLFNLSLPDNARVADGVARGTILDNDATPTISIADISLNEGPPPGTSTASVTITLSAASGRDVTVDFTTNDGTAAQPGDYSRVVGTAVFPQGSTTQTVDVPISGDTVFENNETLFVDLSSPVNASLTDNRGVATIINDDTAPVLDIGDVTLTEGNSGTTLATFPVTKTGTTDVVATVKFSTADGPTPGGAAAPSDYANTTGTVTFAPSETQRNVTVTVNADTMFEGDEIFLVELTQPVNSTIGDAQGQATINNDDSLPSFRVSDPLALEGDSADTTATFVVTKTGSADVTSTVTFTTTDGSATAPGDYSTKTGSLSFGPSTITQTVSVSVTANTVYEFDENFFLDLSAPVNATIADSRGEATIADNDPRPEFTIGDVVLTEGNSGIVSADFTVTKTGATDVTATVNYSTSDGTAAAPGDYESTTGALEFPPGGAVTQTVSVPVNGETIFEQDETFFLNLSSPSQATISDAQGSATITNDDSPPSVSIGDVVVEEGNSGLTDLVFSVTQTAASEVTSTVTFTTADGTASQPSDYVTATGVVTIPPGATEGDVTITVKGDTVYEASETMFVDLSDAVAATIADARGQGTITNDDSAPSVSIADAQVVEGNSGTPSLEFIITKSGETGVTGTVEFTTEDIDAQAGEDYSPEAGTFEIPPGTGAATITVDVFPESIYERNETLRVRLVRADDITLADGEAIGTINNDDAAPVFTINDVSVLEGNTGTSNATYTITKTGPTEVPASVTVTTADGSARSDSDYAAVNSTLVFAPSQGSQTVPVSITGDSDGEPTENYFVNLSAPVDASIADPQGLGTIQNDDGPAPTISVADVSLSEGNSGTSMANFQLSLSAPTGQTVRVTATTTDVTALSPGDYSATSGLVTFGPAATTATFSVPVNGDTIFEADELFRVTLSAPNNATLGDAQADGTVINDDGEPSYEVGNVTLSEGDFGTKNFEFTVTQSGAADVSVTLDFATADGSAKTPSDYVATSGTLTFTSVTPTQTVVVPVNGDITMEEDETFFVNISNPSLGTISDAQGQGTILNNDSVTLAIDDVTVTEGDSGTTGAVFTVSKTGSSEVTSTVAFATADGTATDLSDYTQNSGTLTFGPQTPTATVTVLVKGDSVSEAAETFLVNLTSPTNATITDGEGQGTITNDDSTPEFSIDDVTITETPGGPTNAVFTVTKTGITELTATVQFATADGTAVQPGDYGSRSGTLTFAPSDTTQTVTVPVNDDANIEEDETFFVNLSSPSNATLGDAQGLATITDDDSALPALSINDVTLVEGDSGTSNAVFTVTKTGATESEVTVQFATANGTATQPGDYTLTSGTLTFPASATTQTVTVPVNGDTLFETDETFLVNLSSPTNAGIADGQGQGTITNDDANSQTLTIDDITVTEGNSGTVDAVFTVTKHGDTGEPVTVDFATADDTALQPGDYETRTGSLSFGPTESTKTITVPVAGESVFENDQRFFVNLSNVAGATINDAQGIGTITNDDAAPTFSINDLTVTESSSGTTATLTVTKTGLTELSSSVGFATADGTAVAPGDYVARTGTLTFAPGVTSLTITININGDSTAEGTEHLFVNLASPTNSSITDAQGRVSIDPPSRTTTGTREPVTGPTPSQPSR